MMLEKVARSGEYKVGYFIDVNKILNYIKIEYYISNRELPLFSL